MESICQHATARALSATGTREEVIARIAKFDVTPIAHDVSTAATPKQVAFMRSLSEQTRLEIPAEAFRSKAEASRWLDEARAYKESQSSRSSQQR